MTSEEEEWLAANIIDASLPAGEKWHDIPVQECFFNLASSGDSSTSEDF